MTRIRRKGKLGRDERAGLAQLRVFQLKRRDYSQLVRQLIAPQNDLPIAIYLVLK